MSDSTKNNQRIAKNTVMLYGRMIIMLGITLYTSRVVLQTLGVTDYGIYNVVGGVVALLGFVSNSMSVSVQRFLSYDIGKHDLRSLNRTFNTSVVVHILIALLILLLGETVGLYFVSHYMNFPPERYNAAVCVFHFSLLACVFKILQVPYNALIISLERMEVFAYLSIVEALFSLGVVYLLLIGTSDRLILYAVLLSAVSLLVYLLYGLYCKIKIKEIEYRLLFDRQCFSRLLSFASWSALGEMAWAGTLQGVNIVLNMFFGPAVNAARGISYQVLNAVNRFVQSFQMAVNPQIIKQYAVGDIASMQRLVFRSTRLSFYLLLLLILPLLLRTEYVMQLWLGEVPDHLVAFSRLALINAGLDVFSNLYATVAKAYGKIRNYQLIVSFVLFLNLPLSYMLLKFGCPPEATYWVYSFVAVSLLFVRLFLIRNMVGLNITSYFREVLLPVFVVVVFSLPIPLLVNRYVAVTFVGLLQMICLTSISVLGVVFYVGITSSERLFFKNKIKSLINRKR